MSRIFAIVKIIASAGIAGIGVGFAILGVRDIMGQDPTETLVTKLVLTVAAPLLSAIVAYRNSESRMVIRHVIDGDAAHIPLSKIRAFN